MEQSSANETFPALGVMAGQLSDQPATEPCLVPATFGPVSFSRGNPDFPSIARSIYAARRRRESALGIPRLFSDPAWDILLDVLINEGRLNRVSVSSACIASCVPATTALRWIATLEENGLIERLPDPADARRTFLSLTKKGRARTCAAILATVENDVQTGRSISLSTI